MNGIIDCAARHLLARILPLMLAFLAAVPVAHAQQGEPPHDEAEADCSSNPEVLAEVARKWGGGGEVEVMPWIHPLSTEQVATVEVEENRLTVPKEGNPWLACIEKGDLLWSFLTPEFDRQFARRIIEVTEAPRRMMIRTSNVGLFTVTNAARFKAQGEEPLVKELRARLPSELLDSLQRSYIDADSTDYGASFKVVYRSAETSFLLQGDFYSKERVDEIRSDVEEDAAEQEGMHTVMQGDRATYIMDEAIWVYSFLDRATMQLRSGSMESEQLLAALDALDLDALDALATQVASER